VRSLLLGWCALGFAGSAWAADRLDPEIAKVSERVGVVSDKSTRLLRTIAPGRAYPLRGEAAVQRYIDCITWAMLGESDHAASGLFTLVTTGVLVDAGLHQDAEWSLAQALFEGENHETAEVRLEAILADPNHPFRADAVRLLLEILAEAGRTDEFYGVYQKEIASGKVRATDAITYSVGKSLWIQGSFTRVDALRQFSSIPETSRFYARAQYFIGAIHVANTALVDAIPVFELVTRLPVAQTDDRVVRDTAVLALARIYYERGEFALATEWYNKVAGDSPVLDRALYEIAWTYIKQGKNIEALRAIDVYLLSYPDGDGAAELKVLQGQLHMVQRSWDQALTAFDAVVGEYTPVEEQFASLARSREAPDVYFQRVLALGQGATKDVPEYARVLMLADKDLAAAIHLFSQLDQQRTDLSASQAIIQELKEALSGAEKLDVREMQVQIDNVKRDLSISRATLFDLEESWLAANGIPNAVVGDLAARRKALGADPEPAAVRGLRADYQAARKGKAGPAVARIDDLQGTLDRAASELADAQLRLTSPDVEDIGRLRQVFEQEVRNVEAEEVEYRATLIRSQTVSIELTRGGFGRLEDLFGGSVLAADTGIVDVYWGRRIETVDEKEALLIRQADVMSDLDQRFELIRQKLGQ